MADNRNNTRKTKYSHQNYSNHQTSNSQTHKKHSKTHTCNCGQTSNPQTHKKYSKTHTCNCGQTRTPFNFTNAYYHGKPISLGMFPASLVNPNDTTDSTLRDIAKMVLISSLIAILLIQILPFIVACIAGFLVIVGIVTIVSVFSDAGTEVDETSDEDKDFTGVTGRGN